MNAINLIVELLHEEYGFDPSHPGLVALNKIVEKRCLASRQQTVEEYFFLLENSHEERDALLDAIVVAETFFFRHPESFAALAAWAKTRSHFPLRILSAACSTGEETYSIAISLLDAGFSAKQLLIEGCDVSASAIATARQGIYTQKAFRSGEQEWRDRYFSSTPKGSKVCNELREAVHFRQGNLLTLEGLSAWDIIFCRNAMIYFTAAQQKKTVMRLEEMLADDGILFVGPAEPPIFLARDWGSSGHPMSFSLLKRPARNPSSAVPKVGASRKRLQRPRPASSFPSAKPLVGISSHIPVSLIEKAREFADNGRLEEAQVVLDDILKTESENAEVYFLCGLVAEAQGRESVAEAHYRKMLYLAPTHSDGLQHMALLLRRQGRVQAAENLSRRAAKHLLSKK